MENEQLYKNYTFLANETRKLADRSKEDNRPDDMFKYRANQMKFEMIALENKYGLVNFHTEVLPKLRALCSYEKGKLTTYFDAEQILLNKGEQCHTTR